MNPHQIEIDTRKLKAANIKIKKSLKMKNMIRYRRRKDVGISYR